MPKVTIDGREIEFEPGATVIRAAASADISIPHYCWHPGLSVAGNCRMCLVEVEKMPKLVIGCSTACADGMVVHTDNNRVREARDAVMEFLLINHPLDCPICDQAGECRLQQYSYRYGASGSRFLEEKVHKPKRVDIGPHIVFDAERCILCSRCVRFCQEVTKTNELTIGLRGDHAIVETFPGRSLDNLYSGNTVDICPVGALTLKEFRFRSRVWFLKNTDSVCPGCARGCSIVVGSRDPKILRYTPRPNPLVNAWWMCDEGRLSWQRLEAKRLSWPAMRDAAPAVTSSALAAPPPQGRHTGRPGSWKAVLDATAQRLEAVVKAHGPGAVAVVASSRSTNEDLFMAALLAREALGGSPVFLPVHERGEDDDILIRKDKTPNRSGALKIFAALLPEAADAGAKAAAGEPAGAPPADTALMRAGVVRLEEAIRAGQVRALVILGPAQAGVVEGEAPPLDPAALSGLDEIVLLDAFETPLSTAASAVLPTPAFGEVDGSYANFAGHVQRVRAATPAHADAWPAWKVLQELGRRIAASRAETFPQFTGAQAVFAALAERVPAFAGLSWARLGDHGRPLGSGATGQDGETSTREGPDARAAGA